MVFGGAVGSSGLATSLQAVMVGGETGRRPTIFEPEHSVDDSHHDDTQHGQQQHRARTEDGRPVVPSSDDERCARTAGRSCISRLTLFSPLDEPHVSLMRRCLDLSLESEPSPTAFCVGSLLVLPPPPLTSTSASPSSSSAPLILSSGFSREPPRPTSHAESSALIKFLGLSPSTLGELLLEQSPDARWEGSEGWSHEDVLRRADCYTTLEPCSIRTSGQPDCARLLATHQIRRVFVVRPLSSESDVGHSSPRPNLNEWPEGAD